MKTVVVIGHVTHLTRGASGPMKERSPQGPIPYDQQKG